MQTSNRTLKVGQGSISGYLIRDPVCNARFSRRGLSDDEHAPLMPWLQVNVATGGCRPS